MIIFYLVSRFAAEKEEEEERKKIRRKLEVDLF